MLLMLSYEELDPNGNSLPKIVSHVVKSKGGTQHYFVVVAVELSASLNIPNTLDDVVGILVVALLLAGSTPVDKLLAEVVIIGVAPVIELNTKFRIASQ